MSTKDHFSGHAKLYAAFRPTYPDALYAFIFSHVKNKGVAWDCATGNGQVAHYLADHFQTVYATDLSQNQLDNAPKKDNIQYSISTAEKTSFADNQFDLITVGQALHWFNLNDFYNQVNRVARNNALLAVWGYSLCSITPTIDTMLADFYTHVVGPYWDEARKLVDDHYSSIPFPFAQIPAPAFNITVTWTLDAFLGYLTTWSSTQKYSTVHGVNPVTRFGSDLALRWNSEEIKTVTFPVFLLLGRIKK